MGGKATLKSIELFAGCGGLALGIERAGFENVLCVERDVTACATLEKNRPDWTVTCADVRSLGDRFIDMHNIDLVAGGPPCQPFSGGGKSLGEADDRNMLPAMSHAIFWIKPRAFLIENVSGILQGEKKKYFDFMLYRLREHGYNIIVAAVNAADYGVPQIRKRILVVGYRNDQRLTFEIPKPTHFEQDLLYDQLYDSVYWKRHAITDYVAHRQELVGRGAVDTVRDRVQAVHKRMNRIHSPWLTVRDVLGPDVYLARPELPVAKKYAGHTGSYIDRPAKTLKAGDHGVPGGENMLRRLDGSVRYFTSKEAAALQTFPDDWWLSGTWAEQMRQLGNAVPVLLAEVFATRIRRDLTSGQH